MAALRGTIRGDRRRANSDARSTRLSDRTINVHADTWRTFCETELNRDGSGWFHVVRNGRQMRHDMTMEPANQYGESDWSCSCGQRFGPNDLAEAYEHGWTTATTWGAE